MKFDSGRRQREHEKPGLSAPLAPPAAASRQGAADDVCLEVPRCASESQPQEDVDPRQCAAAAEIA